MRALVILGALGAVMSVAVPASAGPFEDALEIIDDAKQLATRRDEAIGKLKQAVAADPKLAHGWYNLGLLQKMAGDRAAAQASWRTTLTVSPDYAPARARLAQLDLESGKTVEATRALESIVDQNRYQPEARNALAAIAMAAGDYEGAIRHARNVLLGDPDNMNAYLNLAVAYFRQNLVDQAWLIASNALDRRPDAAALHNMMGLIYLKKDDARHATESFLRALTEDPSLVDAKLNLGSLELAYGDFEAALKRFDQVLAVQPKDYMVVISRAVALRGLKRYDEAQQGYEAALAIRPEAPEAVYNLCVLHQQYTQKWQQALTSCSDYMRQIDRKHPKYTEIKKRVETIEMILKSRQAEPAPTPAPAPAPGAAPAGDGTP
jgi:tetratricopeptide (TPR) repeat protein